PHVLAVHPPKLFASSRKSCSRSGSTQLPPSISDTKLVHSSIGWQRDSLPLFVEVVTQLATATGGGGAHHTRRHQLRIRLVGPRLRRVRAARIPFARTAREMD